MAIQTINIGTSANKGDGDPLRTAFKKINDNFAELDVTNTRRDVVGSVFGDDSTLLVDAVNSLIPSSVLSGNLPALDGSALTNLTIPAQTFASLTSKPTTVSGYGITDALAIPGDSIALGTSSSAGAEAVAIGKGTAGVGDYAQAIGNNAGNSGQGVAAVALGSQAGETSQGTKAIAVGQYAGQTSQGSKSVAIGDAAGNATQGAGAIAVGSEAGGIVQGASSVALGKSAGYDNQGDNAVAVGYGAGQTNQAANSIVINASGIALQNTTASSLVIKPIRNAVGTTMLMYDATSGEVTHSGNVTLGGDLDVGGNSIVSASNGAINIAPDGSGTIDLSGQVKFAEGMIEKFATTNGATGVTALDCSTGNVHYLTAPAGDITANFTNLNLTAEYATNVTVVIDQGGTEREITAVQIGGVAQTIVWQGNSAPTGTANGVDSFSFTILNDGGTYVVLGQMVAFGGV